MTDFDEFFQVTETMINFGGSFVSKLGALYRVADDENRAKLLATFPEYWAKYRQMAETRQKAGLA